VLTLVPKGTGLVVTGSGHRNKNQERREQVTTTKKKLEPAGELVGIELVKAALLDRSVKLTVVEEDPEAAARRMIERTLAATSVEELWGAGVVHAKDCVNRAFVLTSVEFRNSDVDEQEGGLPIYAVMHAAFADTGETAVITCGAAGVVTRLIKLIEFDALPISLLIRGSKTRSGFTVFDLDPAPDGF
jgi:hypothetical protein